MSLDILFSDKVSKPMVAMWYCPDYKKCKYEMRRDTKSN